MNGQFRDISRETCRRCGMAFLPYRPREVACRERQRCPDCNLGFAWGRDPGTGFTVCWLIFPGVPSC